MALKTGGDGERTWLRRGLLAGAGTFVLAVLISWPSQTILVTTHIIPAILTLALVVLSGVVFDIIGVAVAVADEAPFHAMAAKRITGARRALGLIRNADRVANFCTDIVGDVAGTISGAAGVVIALRLLVATPALDRTIASVLVVAAIAAVTVGGKAAAKGFAIREANAITAWVGRLLEFVDRLVSRRAVSAPPGRDRRPRRSGSSRGAPRGPGGAAARRAGPRRNAD